MSLSIIQIVDFHFNSKDHLTVFNFFSHTYLQVILVYVQATAIQIETFECHGLQSAEQTTNRISLVRGLSMLQAKCIQLPRTLINKRF